MNLVKEDTVVPKPGLKDGTWEVSAVMSESFAQEVERHVKDEREKAVVFALRDALLRGVQGLEGGRKAVVSMDVWCGVFKKA